MFLFKKVVKFLIAFFAATAVPISMASDQLTPIKVAAFIYPPFSFIDSYDHWTGADIDITTLVLQEMGYKPEYIQKPFKRLLHDLREGNLPMSIPIVEGNEREDYVYFSQPISYLYNVLWKRSDRDIQWQYYSDLANLTIGAAAGYHYGAGFKEAGEAGKFNIEYIADADPDLKNFKKTLLKRIDMFICEINVGRYIQSKSHPMFADIDYSLKGVGPKRPFSVALSKKYFEDDPKKAKAFLTEFNEALQRISKDGTRKRIFKNYGMDIDIDAEHQLIIDKDWREEAEL